MNDETLLVEKKEPPFSGAFSEGMISGLPWIISSKALLFIVYFLVSVITVRQLGAEQYGVYVICKSLSEVLILLCTLGMTASFIRFVPEMRVSQNKAGILRLITKATILQLLAVLLASIGLLMMAPRLEILFSSQLEMVLYFTCGLVLLEVVKANVNALLTAFYQIKWLSLYSLIQGICWLVLLYYLLIQSPTVSAALLASIASSALIYIIAGAALFRYIRSLDWRSPATGIGRKRVFKHSGSVAASTCIRLMMLKYTELFFLGVHHDAKTVGLYDLAYSIPLMVIVFIPAAIQNLCTTGLSEAYVRDQNCLPELIRAQYKLLILSTVPLAVFGFYFSPVFFTFFYGEQMANAGRLASYFCLFHLLPLVSIPLSMAIQAKEKVFNMLPTLVLQLVINIALDYWLIVVLGLGVWGAFGAVVITFFLTIPFRLWLVCRLIGGLYIPYVFFLKIFGMSLIVGYGVLHLISITHQYSLVLSVLFYGVLLLICLLFTKILSNGDIQDFTKLSTGKPKKLLSRFSHFRNQPFGFQL
ncbi:MAG: oligosaccharide flippase family protein [Pseudomonadales bacterium]|nr:oligosaccharide flippase family protein [Pseudomonadales bacterium]